MKLEDEIVFFINAKNKADESGKGESYETRLKVLFAEGQISTEAYPLLRQIFGYLKIQVTPEKPATVFRGGC